MNLLFLKKIYAFLYLLSFRYCTPISLNYWWNIGSLLLFWLISQIITGLFLAFWYIPYCDLAFLSVDFIMRNVYYGWFIRYLHANGASFFFFLIYLHICKNIFYSSFVYPREVVWYTGGLIFFLLIFIAFVGYVLPWGQMSYWAATVITSLISVLPMIGQDLLIFIWGSISIDQPTITRLFGLHFLLPFVLLCLVGLHIIFLHELSSNNPLSLRSDLFFFHPIFTIKDIYGVIIFLFPSTIIIFFYPNILSHVDNYIPANIEITPPHIVPEWYFLPFYGLLRAIPNKLGGVLLIFFFFTFFFFFPNILKIVLIRNGEQRPFFQINFWLFVSFFVLIGWLGSKPVEYPFYGISQYSVLIFFFCFFFGFNLCNLIDWFFCYNNFNKNSVNIVR